MTSSPSATVILVVDLAERPLLHNMSSFNDSLAQSTEDPISIYVISDMEYNRPIPSVLESVALREMIGLLRNDVDRIDDLCIETEYRSSLTGVGTLVRSMSRGLLSRTTLFYTVDDCPGYF